MARPVGYVHWGLFYTFVLLCFVALGARGFSLDQQCPRTQCALRLRGGDARPGGSPMEERGCLNPGAREAFETVMKRRSNTIRPVHSGSRPVSSLSPIGLSAAAAGPRCVLSSMRAVSRVESGAGSSSARHFRSTGVFLGCTTTDRLEALSRTTSSLPGEISLSSRTACSRCPPRAARTERAARNTQSRPQPSASECRTGRAGLLPGCHARARARCVRARAALHRPHGARRGIGRVPSRGQAPRGALRRAHARRYGRPRCRRAGAPRGGRGRDGRGGARGRAHAAQRARARERRGALRAVFLQSHVPLRDRPGWRHAGVPTPGDRPGAPPLPSPAGGTEPSRRDCVRGLLLDRRLARAPVSG